MDALELAGREEEVLEELLVPLELTLESRELFIVALHPERQALARPLDRVHDRRLEDEKEGWGKRGDARGR